MARNQKTLQDLLDLLNQKAIYSTNSGLPVTFVKEITVAERMNPEGVYSDLVHVIDNTAETEEDLSGMFAVNTEGDAQGFDELFARLGNFTQKPDTVYRNASAVLADRADIVITPVDEDGEGEDEEDSVEIYTNDGCDSYSGIAVRAEDVAPAEVFAELIRRMGLSSAREAMIEFLATVFPSEGENGEDRLVEVFYRISGGDAWFRAYSLGEKEEELDMESLFPELLQNIVAEIDWERVLDSAPLDDPPTIDASENGKVLRPFRRR